MTKRKRVFVSFKNFDKEGFAVFVLSKLFFFSSLKENSTQVQFAVTKLAQTPGRLSRHFGSRDFGNESRF